MARPPARIDVESLRAHVLKILDENDIPGASIAMVGREAVIWADGVGKADVANDIDVRADHLFRVGSTAFPGTGHLSDRDEEPSAVLSDHYPQRRWSGGLAWRRRAPRVNHHDSPREIHPHPGGAAARRLSPRESQTGSSKRLRIVFSSGIFVRLVKDV